MSGFAAVFGLESLSEIHQNPFGLKNIHENLAHDFFFFVSFIDFFQFLKLTGLEIPKE